MVEPKEFLNDIKMILDLDNTTMYDDKLNFFIPASLNKMKNEGLPNIVEKSDENYHDFTLCLALEVAKYIDIDADVSRIHLIVTDRKLVLREALRNVETR